MLSAELAEKLARIFKRISLFRNHNEIIGCMRGLVGRLVIECALHDSLHMSNTI